MAKLIDVRNAGGELVVLGGALVLPTNAQTITTPMSGSLRYNSGSDGLEYYSNTGAWEAVGGGGGSIPAAGLILSNGTALIDANLSPFGVFSTGVELASVPDGSTMLRTTATQFMSGTLLNASSTTVVPTATPTVMTWTGSPQYDVLGFWNASQPTRLTVPAAPSDPGQIVKKLRVTAQIDWSGTNYTAGVRRIKLLQNGSDGNCSSIMSAFDPTGISTSLITQTLVSPIFFVSPGDYFEIEVTQSSGANMTPTGGYHFFQIEVWNQDLPF